MRYMLDTNMCIYLMKNKPDSVVARFAQCAPGDVRISAITWAELCAGMHESGVADMQMLASILMPIDFDAAAALVFGKLSQEYPNRKASFDRMIAAHAISVDAILVTNNLADFALYQPAGLRLENWV